MSLPKYKHVANTLAQRIHEQIYLPLSRLPAQQQLAAEFGVSRTTVQKAAHCLAQQGLIWKHSGAGTYVRQHAAVDRLQGVTSWFEGLTAVEPEQTVTTVLLRFTISLPTPLIQAKLKLTPDEPVYMVDRLRKKNGRPVSIEHNVLPVKYVGQLTRSQCRDSLYQHLQCDLHLRFSGAKRTFNAECANEQDRQYLRVIIGAPIFIVEQVTWITAGDPVIYATLRNPASAGGFLQRDSYQ